jgi:ketosteroid isomerase-like protein
MPDDMTRATIEAVQRFNDALNSHDVDAAIALMTDDTVFESTSPPDGERYVGAAAVRAVWEQLFADAPTAHFDTEEMIATGDRCVVRWMYTWEERGAQQHVRGVDVLRVRDGKVAEKLAYVKG